MWPCVENRPDFEGMRAMKSRLFALTAEICTSMVGMKNFFKTCE
jgi:hypothetical protein